MYRHVFDTLDQGRCGWLSRGEAATALRIINTKLNSKEEEFLYRVLELTGYNTCDGVDFKVFSVLAALSQRITSLDSWMKLMIQELDFKHLEIKTFLCKKLWEICVDPTTKTIPLEQLIVELRSGGVSESHEASVKERLGHLPALDLLDFLTYSPLFIMIHQAIVDNPLSVARDT
ncbi:uncharacterized protein LOC131951780 [Physella acuta]|uniref:uncharacterized protein LOC131951780 n=1 Tax=Physella acuta TaxID=109671 RepID=UPI0027DAD32C|nr:uncharacterized protein LOC131951780 [Physella acuta]